MIESWASKRVPLCIGGEIRRLSSSLLKNCDQLFAAVVEEGYGGVKNQIFSGIEYDNQDMNEVRSGADLEKIVGAFESPIEGSFGYGSGVFEQAGYKTSRSPQIDLIYMVKDSWAFHAKNLEQNPDHYSGLRYLGGSSIIPRIQRWGAGVYFNPYVQMKKMTGELSSVKYGTVSTEDALTDISEWSSLYIAGRLHKPVRFLQLQNPAINALNQYNLRSAASLAILMMKKPRFTEAELYEGISKISYMGDLRMIIGGENPNKVRNIVSKQFSSFQKLYKPLLDHLEENNQISRNEGATGTVVNSRLDTTKRAQLIEQLPLQFRKRLYNLYSSKYSKELSKDPFALKTLYGNAGTLATSSSGHFSKALADDIYLRKSLVTAVTQTVALPALVQTIKGIFSAGIVKSIHYAWEKNTKYRQN